MSKSEQKSKTKSKPKNKKSSKNDKQYTRKELLQLSSKQLKIISNRNKCKTSKNPTKMDLVHTILSHQKLNRLKTNDKRELTPLRRAEYLTSGYVRSVITSISKNTHKYDHQLSKIVGGYIGYKLFLCFDVYHGKYSLSAFERPQ